MPLNEKTPRSMTSEFFARTSVVHTIGFQTGIQGANFVRVRVGVAEEDFEGAGVHKDERFAGRMKDEG